MDSLITVILYVITLLIAIFLLNRKKIIDKIITHNRISTLDGLRGILATSVMTHHFYITYIWKKTGNWIRPESDLLNNLGAIGVSFFFLITGFLFVGKLYKNEINWIKLYQSRLRRILPLYYFIVLLVVLITFSQFSFDLSALNYQNIVHWLKQWLLFKSAVLSDDDGGLIIAGVNWTLRYEWLFYLFLPLLSLFISKNKWHKPSMDWLILIITTILAIYLYRQLDNKFMLLFILGGSVAIIDFHTDKFKHYLSNTRVKKNLLSLFIIIISIFLFYFTEAYTKKQMMISGLIFAFFVADNDLFGLLKLNGLRVLGEISYSIYLLHGIVLYLLFTQFNIITVNNLPYWQYLLFYPLVFTIVVGSSLGTYCYIEKYFLRKDRRLPLLLQITTKLRKKINASYPTK